MANGIAGEQLLLKSDNVTASLKSIEEKMISFSGQMKDVIEKLDGNTRKMQDHYDVLQKIEKKIFGQNTPQTNESNNNQDVWRVWLGGIQDTWNIFTDSSASGGQRLVAIFAALELVANKVIDSWLILGALGGKWLLKKIGGKINLEDILSGTKRFGGKAWDKVEGAGGKAWDGVKNWGGKAAESLKWAGNKGASGVQTGLKVATEFGGKSLNNIMSYSKGLLQAAKSVNLLGGAQRILNLIMNMNPIGIMIIALGLLIANWDTIKAVLTSVWAKFQEVFPGLAKVVETYVGFIINVWTQLPERILTALSNVYEAITGSFSRTFEWLSDKFSWVRGVWSSLFGGGGSKGGGAGPGDVQSNARGGIIMHPILTTFAEEGPEAAIPLDGSSRAMSLWYTAGRMLGMFDEQKPGLGASLPMLGGGADVNQGMNFSPTINITINGNADNNTVQQVRQAAESALTDLQRQLKELQWQEKRLSFD